MIEFEVSSFERALILKNLQTGIKPKRASTPAWAAMQRNTCAGF